eukprot:scaffold222513_cov40-Prasinocladus_malaysianus.AAC.1
MSVCLGRQSGAAIPASASSRSAMWSSCESGWPAPKVPRSCKWYRSAWHGWQNRQPRRGFTCGQSSNNLRFLFQTADNKRLARLMFNSGVVGMVIEPGVDLPCFESTKRNHEVSSFDLRTHW